MNDLSRLAFGYLLGLVTGAAIVIIFAENAIEAGRIILAGS